MLLRTAVTQAFSPIRLHRVSLASMAGIALFLTLLIPSAIGGAAVTSHPIQLPVWNGTSWTDVSTQTTLSPKATLTDTFCINVNSCFGVGYKPQKGIFQPIAVVWSGKGVHAIPTPTFASGAEFTDVSCNTSMNCSVIGVQNNLPLAEYWDGEKSGGFHGWHQRKLPVNPVFPQGSTVIPRSISCINAVDYCWAALTVKGSDGTVEGTSFDYSRGLGIAWTAPYAEVGNEYDQVSCVWSNPSELCVAVGSTSNGCGQQCETQPLIDQYSPNTGWTAQESFPKPTSSNEAISLVRCASTISCVALGEDDAGQYALQWNGATWSLTPADQSFNPTSVSCAKTTACFAFGSSSGSESQYYTEQWDGTEWSPTSYDFGPITCPYGVQWCIAFQASVT
jgi:hypothetical protein